MLIQYEWTLPCLLAYTTVTPVLPFQETVSMAPFPPTASCVLPMNAHKYYAIQDTPSFRSLLAQVRLSIVPVSCLKSPVQLLMCCKLVSLHLQVCMHVPMLSLGGCLTRVMMAVKDEIAMTTGHGSGSGGSECMVQ